MSEAVEQFLDRHGHGRRLERLAMTVGNLEGQLDAADLTRALLRRAEQARAGDHRVYLAWAEAVAAAATQVSGPEAERLRVLALAELGNARRLNERFQAAQQCFRQIGERLEALSPGDRAEILHLHGALLTDLTKPQEAAALVQRACDLTRGTPRAEKYLIQLSVYLVYCRSFRQAQTALRRALDSLTEDLWSKEMLGAAYGGGVKLYTEWARETASPARRREYLNRARAAAGAARLFVSGRQAVELDWMVARGMMAADERDEAGELLDDVVRRFQRLELHAAAAEASIDLTEVYLRDGEAERARDLASACLVMFQAAELPAEMLAALRQLADAGELRAARAVLASYRRRERRRAKG
jgi:hypothetical protein